MRNLINLIRDFQYWRQLSIIVIPVVIILIIAYVYFFIFTVTNTSLSENQRLLTVTKGDLVNDVSVNGKLVYAETQVLKFTSTNGKVADVYVDEGTTVKAGQKLAIIDSETIANLEKIVTEAKISVRNAEESLENTKTPYTALQLASAKYDVASAKLALDVDTQSLEDLTSPSPQTLAQLQHSISLAEKNLETDQENLDNLQNPSLLSIAQATELVESSKKQVEKLESELQDLKSTSLTQIKLINQKNMAITNAQLALDSAQEELTLLEKTPTIVTLENDIELATTKLQNQKTESAATIKNLENQIEDHILTSLDVSTSTYVNKFDGWLGLDISGETTLSPTQIITNKKIDLDSLFNKTNQKELIGQRPSADDPATPWNEITLYLWLAFSPFKIIGTCETNPSNLNTNKGFVTKCVSWELDQAWEQLKNSRETHESLLLKKDKTIVNLDQTTKTLQDELDKKILHKETLQSGGDLLLKQKQLQVSIAKSNLAQAQQDLLDTEAAMKDTGYLITQINRAKANHIEAKNALAELTLKPNQTEIQHLKNKVQLSKENLASAKENLELAKSPDLLTKASKQAKIEKSSENVKSKEESLKDLIEIDALAIQLKEKAFQVAQEKLKTAEDNLKGATITSPIDGIISRVNIEKDQQINANTNAFTIINPRSIELVGAIDEIDILFINPDSRAFITIEALPDTIIKGMVSYISSTSETQAGVVTYPVKITLEIPENLTLSQGLSGVAQIIIREEKDSILIPIQSLGGSMQTPTVLLYKDNVITEQPITLGISDDFWTVVTSGLKEGDQIVMDVIGTDTSSGSNFRAIGGISGGRSFGGGGRPPSR